MDFAPATWWWVAAGVMVAVELATGTFYLLMIGLGFAAAALATHAGASVTAQLVAAALVGGGATALWHWRRAHHPRSLPAERNRDVNLDVGERVQVAAWSADGTARVNYRGTQWTARLATGAPAAPGAHRVAAVEGNWLVLEPAQG